VDLEGEDLKPGLALWQADGLLLVRLHHQFDGTAVVCAC
jgi:hypothetical protein